MQYAGFWVRAGALLIDCALIFGDGSHEVAAAALLVFVLYPLLMPLTKLRCTLEKHFLEFALFLMIQADG